MTFASAFFFSLPSHPKRKNCVFVFCLVFTTQLVRLRSPGTGEKGESAWRGVASGRDPSQLVRWGGWSKGKGWSDPHPEHRRAADVNREYKIPPEPTAFL